MPPHKALHTPSDVRIYCARSPALSGNAHMPPPVKLELDLPVRGSKGMKNGHTYGKVGGEHSDRVAPTIAAQNPSVFGMCSTKRRLSWSG